LLLSPPHPYEFKRLVDVLSRFAVRPHFCLTRAAYWRGLRIGDAAGAVRLSDEAGCLRVELHGWHTPPNPLGLERAVRALAGLHLDLAPFYARARADAALWAWLEPLAGLPLFSSADLYDALTATIIEQHISWTAALGVQARFAALFGAPISTPAGIVYAPPAPAQIAALSRADLAPLKLTTARLDLLIRASQLIADGAFDGWQQADPQALYAALLRVKGIGHWTATVTVGRALGVQPHLHDNDAALQAAVNAFFYQRAGRASLDETRAAFAPYGTDAPLIAQLLMLRWVIARYAPQPFDVE
jgi:3-methyladenine DNA glycosylase/8-oxoguanine DNA glycosylase